MSFKLKSIDDKLNNIMNTKEKKLTKRAHTFKLFFMAFIICIAILISAFGAGALLGIIDNAPDVNTLSFSPKGYATNTYDINGNLVDTLVKEGSNREEASFEELPETLINAFVAIEDKRFWEHNGIDLRSITRAIKGVFTGDKSAGGGSTLTQQLIKNNVFAGGSEKGFELYERKFQEWYIALLLENQPGKEKIDIKKEIITDYLNTINLGNNTLGVKRAAKRYFGKELSKLNLAECSVLAAIPKNPSKYNPITRPDDNETRRLRVLDDMLEQGYISEEEKENASSMAVYDEIKLNNDNNAKTIANVYSYFTDALIDQVLKALINKKGLTETEAKDMLYSGGLKIMTTEDPAIRDIVNEEVNNPDNYDTAKYSFKWRFSIDKKEGGLTHYSEKDVDNYFKNIKGKSNYNGLFRTKDAVNEAIEEYKSTIYNEDEDEIVGETLDMTLEPQVSFVIMDQDTKEVRALSGGRGDKEYSLTINRAYNTYRQPGSAFKVITSFGPAIEESGASLGTVYYDSEYTVGNKTFKNWWKGGNYFGYSNIREGIEFSMNIIAVRCLMETVSPEEGLDFARRLGISSLSDDDAGAALALGGISKGVTNLELTNAYATIADQGMYGEPKLFTKIYDHNGKVLIDNDDADKTRVFTAESAYLLTDAMKGSVTGHTKWGSGFTVNNTSSRARLDNMSVAGKSGTTSKNNDIWFVGFSPYYTAGVWAGCDDNQSLSDSASGEYNGGTSFHKDIWRKIMTRVHENLENKDFERPEGIVEIEICRKSGKLPTEGCFEDVRGGSSAVYTEVYDIDKVPTEKCNHHRADGSVIVPDDESAKYTDDEYHKGNTESEGEEESEAETVSQDEEDTLNTDSKPIIIINGAGPAPGENSN